MCFSATASFSAAIVLGVIGLLALRAARHRSYYPFAMIPIFFALQQATEGVTWMTHGMHAWSIYLYLVFVLMVWPVWIPFSVWMVEPVKVRADGLLGLLAFGAAGAAAYAVSLFAFGATAAVGEHISYFFTLPANLPARLGLVGYILIVVGSCALSSKRYINLFGLLVFVAAVLTWLILNIWFTSIWCFFGAIISCGVYSVIRYFDKGVA